MKNRILAILAIFLVTLSGVSINATPVNAAIAGLQVCETSSSCPTTFNIDFANGLTHNVEGTDTFVLKNNGGESIDITISYEPVSGESISITSISPNSFSLMNGSAVTVTVKGLATRSQEISLNDNTKFGGSIVVSSSSESTKIPLRTLVKSDLLSFDTSDSEDELEDPLEPGDSVSLTMEIDNTLGKDIEIDDMELSVLDIDDGDDIDIEFDGEDEINSGKSEDYDFDFEIPFNVDEATFDIVLTMDFEDEDGNQYDITGRWDSAVEVEKDEDKNVEFTTFTINQENPSCGAILNVNIEVINTGNDDLDDTVVVVSIDETDISERSTPFDLNEDDYDEREASLSMNLRLPSDMEPGTYTLKAGAYYKGSGLISETIKDFTVRCGTTSSSDNEDSEDSSEDEVIDRDTNNGVTGSTVYVPTSPFGNLFGSNGTGAVVFWVIVDLILLLVAIWLLKVIFRRRKRE